MDEIIMDGLRIPEVSVTFTNITQGEIPDANSRNPQMGLKKLINTNKYGE